MWRVGHGQPAAVGTVGLYTGSSSAVDSAPIAAITDAPVEVPKKQKVAPAGAAFGFMKPLVFAAMLGAGLAAAGSPAHAQGAPIDSDTVIEAPSVDHRYTLTLPESLVLQPDLNLQPWERVEIPLHGPPPSPSRTRGEIVLEQLMRDLEQLMRVTPRDMANPNTPFIEGAPGYREPPRDEVLRLIEVAVRKIPLGELPGGRALASLVTALPNAGALDAENMSVDEISRELGSIEGRWLESKLRPLIEGYEIEAGVATFAAITAARASSSEVAGVMDGVIPAVTVWRTRSDDGGSDARVRLRYRNEEILPNIDLRARTTRTYGPFVLRGEIAGTLSIENERHLTGTATAGANWSEDGRFVDASATYYDNGQSRVSVTAGYANPDTRTIAFTNLTGVFGPGQQNRVSWEVDFDRQLSIYGADGSLGVYTGVTVNTDGTQPDFRAGLVFRLTF